MYFVAYQSIGNLTGFHGFPSPWAINAANWSFERLLNTKSRIGFLTKHDATGGVSYILPRLAADEFGLCMLYSPKLSLTPALIADGNVRELLADQWRTLCRAYIDVDVSPRGRLAFHNHEATVRAANALLTPSYPFTPTLAEIDAAFDTSLSVVAERQSQNAKRIIEECNW